MTTIKTKFGNASIDKQGYYTIHSNEKGNRGKKLHRLIFEDFYNIKLPKDIDIHHEDGNRINNEIWNLVPIPHSEHSTIHGCVHTEEFKRKMSESKKGEKHPNYGKHHPQFTLKKMSNALNTSGYFRVIKIKDKRYNQGFIWGYNYYDENGKRHRITGMTIERLKEKVIAKGLEWFKIGDDDNACEN